MSEERTTNSSVLYFCKPPDQRGLRAAGSVKGLCTQVEMFFSFLTSTLHGTCFFHSPKHYCCFYLQFANNDTWCCVKYQKTCQQKYFFLHNNVVIKSGKVAERRNEKKIVNVTRLFVPLFTAFE